SDFNTTFGGAPCDDGTGCPFNEIIDFEIFASEAYAMDNIVLGGTYIFSACNGTGGTAWPIDYTIIAPSGAVDASGTDPGSNCAITWTATEEGTYLIVVNEEGACGFSDNTAVNNGFPAITCVTGPEVDCLNTGLVELDGTNGLLIYPNPTQGIFTLQIPEVQAGNSSITVIDLSGRVILQNTISHNDRIQQVLDLSGEPTGPYMIQVISADQVVSTRVMIIE
ncbi:MAG: T9SS type A sorting domain-containing protein, partial [Bacteroidota bacterium]|nr:T9SS type A sorting domain-containing protein [Bacteroidota bacterium]